MGSNLGQRVRSVHDKTSKSVMTSDRSRHAWNRSIRNSSSSSSSSSNAKNSAPPPPPPDVPYLTYSIVGGLAITIAGGLKYLHDLFDGTEGLKRAIRFYSIALPKYGEYRYHMWKDSPQEVWDELDRKTSQIALEIMMELKGFYIKSGQICASNIGNAFPKIWQDTMAVFQDQVPHKDFSVIRQILQEEYGQDTNLEDIFESIEETPIGAASIGQVHRAVLKHNQQPVVVKIMYPEVEQLFRGDVRCIRLFAQLAQPVHVPAIEEIEKQFMNEFDYKQEAKQLATVKENLTKAGFTTPATAKKKQKTSKNRVTCVLPEPYLDLCRKRVMVMEELDGIKLQVALEEDLDRNAARMGISAKELRDDIQQKVDEAKKRGEAYLGPNAQEYEHYITLLDQKRQSENLYKMLYNIFVASWIPGCSKKPYALKQHLPLNHAQLIDDLIYVHGHEVLVDGYFNGDPHPGNILLGYHEGEQQHLLELIDYGQVPTISKEMRIHFCQLILALAKDDRPEILRLMKICGYKSRDMNPDNIYLYAKVAYDEDNDDLTGGLHIQTFLEELQAKDPIISLPRPLLMASRTSTTLRGLAHALHQSRSVAKLWEPIAKEVLLQHEEEQQEKENEKQL